jgi:hypothetical protein
MTGERGLPISRRQFLQLFVLATGASMLPRGVFPKKQDEAQSELVKKAESGGNSYKLLNTEKTTGIIRSSSLPVIYLPLNPDYFYNTKGKIEVADVSFDNVDYQNIFTLRGNNNEALRATILPHFTGGGVIPVAILDEGGLDATNNYSIKKKNYYSLESFGKEIVSTFTYSAKKEIYPHKILNVLEALSALTEYQERFGQFKKDQTYSYWEILDLNNRNYVLGKNSEGKLVKGGGICATVSTICKSIFLGGGTFPEKNCHPSSNAYWISPADPKITYLDTDATVNSDGERVFDLKFKLPFDGYLSAKATLVADPNAEQEGDYDPCTTRMSFTVSLSRNKPTGESDALKNLKKSYQLYRDSKGKDVSQIIMDGGKIEGEYDWVQTKEENIAKIDFPEMITSDFESELAGDPYISEVNNLMGLINKYAATVSRADVVSNKALTLGKWLRETGWYKSKVKELNSTQLAQLDSSLRMVDWDTYVYGNEKDGYQAIQCIGFMILLANLGKTGCPKNIGGQSIVGVADLVVPEIRNAKTDADFTLSGEMIYYAGKKMTMDKVNDGDLFVRYDTGAGHIGAVIGKKVVNSEIILLIADANRKNDGEVRIFEVRQNNFDAIFSRYPYKKVLIR